MTHLNLTILVDNHAEAGLASEHGLSMWIEPEGDKPILFDTGAGKLFVDNAKKRGIDVYTADRLVLSHGHYDHTGGVGSFLRHNRHSRIYCHPGAVVPRYAVRGGMGNPIHMPHESIAAIDKLPETRLHWVQEPLILSDDIGLTGHIPRKTDFETPGGPFFYDPAGRRPDPIDDDMALWVHTPRGLVVVVGCCHAGVVNTLDYIRYLNDGMHVHALVGGFHLMGAGSLRLERTMDALKTFDIDLLVPCHCTGDDTVKLLSDTFGDRVSPGFAGKVLQI
ncbi:MAG: MBL fold metallo-hydrolase [Deltaproteobacteria bacterium]|nr:MBL fold metallo-hydrolase [Deltaproteobacteria bacterium]